MKGKGLVVARTGNSYQVEIDQGDTVTCHARSKSVQAVCGDQVEIDQQPHTAVIVSILPRNNVIQRVDRFHRTKTLAANVDQLIIVTAAQPAYDLFGIDRYLLFAHSIHAQASIVFNKMDLTADENFSLSILEQIYQPLGYAVIGTSCHESHGLDPLLSILNHKSNILVGQSGVGKSSLVNALIPSCPAQVGELSSAIEQGTHTTSQTRSYSLANKARLIDSPGIRQFTPIISDYAEIHRGFIEINRYSQQCRFNNCRHLQEPDCAVKTAVENGDIHSHRYDSYVSIAQEMVGDD